MGSSLVHSFLALVLVAGLSPRVLRSEDRFVRGDVDQSGAIAIADALGILRILFPSHFHGGVPPLDCAAAADANDDGHLNITDAVDLLVHLFAGGPNPPPPFPLCGTDPSADSLGCVNNGICGGGTSFYGQAIDADGIFLVIDSSGTIQDSGELQIAKRETIHLTFNMSPDVQFGFVFFDRSIAKFPASGMPAHADSTDMVLSSTAFVEGVEGGAGVCCHEALLEALSFAEASTASKKVILFLSDGGGTCPGGGDEGAYLISTLKDVARANAGKAIINTIGVLQMGAIQEMFLKNLAAQNGGTYTRITR